MFFSFQESGKGSQDICKWKKLNSDTFDFHLRLQTDIMEEKNHTEEIYKIIYGENSLHW